MKFTVSVKKSTGQLERREIEAPSAQIAAAVARANLGDKVKIVGVKAKVRG